MYLKSIEVQGFKSFANKIVFEFHNGITGIVGPNGSGKSNVADAVRWVLGEQSAKQLRGAKMEDVIFSGTENRKSQGFAYVALTIENSDHKLSVDYELVTVSRRVYRSGESEYQINGSACRLKDIHELFYDTGIGKEGYSIIGQGQIDRILSGKPEERRELFDEAAGIVKFKRRKAEAVRKLEEEKQNLTRIQDILSELEKQVGPLEKQAEKAKEYLKIREELKNYDINVFLLETDELKEKQKELLKKSDIAKGDLEHAKIEYESVKEAYEKLETQISQKEAWTKETQERWNSARLEGEKLEGDIALLKEQINSEQIQEESRKKRKISLQSDIEEKKREIEKNIQKKQKVEEKLEKIKERQMEEEKELSVIEDKIQTDQKKIEKNRTKIIEWLNEKSNVKTKMQRYDTMLEQIQIRKSELSGRILEYKSEEELKKEEISGFSEDFQKITEEIRKEEEKRTQLSARIQTLHEQNQKMEQKKNSCQQEYHTKQSQLASLKNLTERYEGYGNSIRRVMDLKEKNRGIIGVVADIIKTDKKYETAIETALGGSIQNIVTDTEQTAKQMIEYLKKNQYGRATFLPLDGISDRNFMQNKEVCKEQGVIGIASDLIYVEDSYKIIAIHLLGRVVVADTIDHALQLARKYHYTLRIVTLEGELLNIGGSMTGGAFKNSSNLLGRRREMEELENQVDELSARYQDFQEKMKVGKKENENNRLLLEQLKSHLQENYILQNTAKMNLERAKKEKENLQKNFELLCQEGRELEKQTKEIQGNISEYQKEIEQIEQDHKKFEKEIEDLLDAVKKEESKENEQKKKTEKIRMEYAALRQESEFLLENLKRVQKEWDRISEELRTLLEGEDKSAKTIAEKLKEIEKLKKAIQDAVWEEEKQKKKIQLLELEKEKLSASQKEGLSKREALTEQITALEKEVFRLESMMEKTDTALDQASSYMWDEYEITYSEALSMRDETLNHVQEMKKQVLSLRGKIKALGSVNVNSIEDYKEVSERYEFLKEQHEDLISAEESLKKIIDELDSGMRKQFIEKFEEIRVEFDKVFKELFGGGKGTLELMEEEDILEAGIRIISQPPGKKLQNMMQLSGGEKALTAIALLFAIQNLKPSPFCLLDEIEAALDDSNVGRYAKYLHKLTAYTQFIVITHRRGTMKAADRLYGITMQEKGVSTLVSVDLIESQLDEPPKVTA